MAYYEDEIPKELVVGENYTAKQLDIFPENNNNVVYLTDQYWSLGSDRTFKVTDHQEKYLMKMSDTSYRTHVIPNSKSNIYKVESVPN